MTYVPFLTTTPYVPPQQAIPTPSPSSNAVEDLIDYLNNVEETLKSFSPKLHGLWGLQRLKDEVNKIFEELKKFKVEEGNSALEQFAKVYTIKGIEEFDPLKVLQYARQNTTSVLKNNRRTKVKLILKCNMESGNTPEEMEIKPADFHSNIEINLDGTDEKELYDTTIERILENMASFQNMGSPLKLRSIIQLELHTVSYNPLKGETYIPLPKEAIINMKNKDNNKCFLWCVLRQ